MFGQVDPVPPPVRPVSWPMIIGWTAVVGVTLAIFNGTINLGSVRSNRRRSSRRVRRNSSKLRIVSVGQRAPTDGSYFLWAVPFTRRQWERFLVDHQALARGITLGKAEKAIHDAMLTKLDRAGFDVALPSNVQFKGEVRRNTNRRSSRVRPKMSEMGVWNAVGVVRAAHPREHLDVLPPGVAKKFKRLAPGLYKYGHGTRGEAIVRFKNASLRGAMTSTRIGATKSGEYHWVIDNFDPSFPVVVRGIDDHGKTYFRIEEYAKRFARVPVAVRKASK